MKRILSSFLLIVFLFNIFGYYLTFLLSQHKNEEEMESFMDRLSLEEMDIIKISAADLSDPEIIEYVKDEREIRYKGRLYDVAKEERTLDSLTFYCIDDKKETGLYADLLEYIEESDSDDKDAHKKDSKQAVKKISSDFFHDLLFPDVCFSMQAVAYSRSTIFYFSFIGKTLSPPPKA